MRATWRPICVTLAETGPARRTRGLQDNEGKRKTPAPANPKLGHSPGRARPGLRQGERRAALPRGREHFRVGTGPGPTPPPRLPEQSGASAPPAGRSGWHSAARSLNPRRNPEAANTSSIFQLRKLELSSRLEAAEKELESKPRGTPVLPPPCCRGGGGRGGVTSATGRGTGV